MGLIDVFIAVIGILLVVLVLGTVGVLSLVVLDARQAGQRRRAPRGRV